jgi:DNA-binding MarR family transcriptional regulator
MEAAPLSCSRRHREEKMSQSRQNPSHRAPALAEMLCFAVYGAHQAFSRVYKALLAPMGLTYPQYLALLALFEQDGRTVGELGEQLGLESSTLTPLLKRMEAAGLLVRARDAADERQVRVSLTGQGEALRAPASEIPEKLLAASGLTIERVMALRGEIESLAAQLQATAKN